MEHRRSCPTDHFDEGTVMSVPWMGDQRHRSGIRSVRHLGCTVSNFQWKSMSQSSAQCHLCRGHRNAEKCREMLNWWHPSTRSSKFSLRGRGLKYTLNSPTIDAVKPKRSFQNGRYRNTSEQLTLQKRVTLRKKKWRKSHARACFAAPASNGLWSPFLTSWNRIVKTVWIIKHLFTRSTWTAGEQSWAWFAAIEASQAWYLHAVAWRMLEASLGHFMCIASHCITFSCSKALDASKCSRMCAFSASIRQLLNKYRECSRTAWNLF